MSEVEGTEVRPRRARDAFCRCEQTFDNVTSDISSSMCRVMEGGSRCERFRSRARG